MYLVLVSLAPGVEIYKNFVSPTCSKAAGSAFIFPFVFLQAQGTNFKREDVWEGTAVI